MPDPAAELVDRCYRRALARKGDAGAAVVGLRTLLAEVLAELGLPERRTAVAEPGRIVLADLDLEEFGIQLARRELPEDGPEPYYPGHSVNPGNDVNLGRFVAEPSIEKKKPKKRRRSARVYINANRPLAVPLDEIAEHFPSDDDDGQDDGPAAKSYLGEPYPGQSFAEHRVSEPLTAGHQAPSPSDHGVGQGRNPGLAAHHGDLRQSNTSFDTVLARLRTVNGDNQNGDRSVTYTAGEVGLRMFNAAGQAGSYGGMQPVNPSPERPDWHTARNSATPPTSGHSPAMPTSAPRQSMKASDAREVMKRHLFGGSGGGR